MLETSVRPTCTGILRNILLGINSVWYLGRSGRYTDPFLFSRDQRISELEATFSYEI